MPSLVTKTSGFPRTATAPLRSLPAARAASCEDSGRETSPDHLAGTGSNFMSSEQI